jgi:Mn-dependent DtxR family transcriptional regulator
MLPLADAAAVLGVSQRTVTSMYARLFAAGLLAERVPPGPRSLA